MTVRARKRWKFKTYPSVNPWWAFLAVVPALISIVVFGVLPALLTVVMSFTDYDGIWQEANFVLFKNYINFFTVLKGEVFGYLWNTFRYALMTVIPLQVLAIGSALLVNGSFRGRSFFRALFFMPQILGGAVIALVWKLMFDPTVGPFSKLLALFGKSSAFFGDPNISLTLISVVALWSSFGFSMTIYLAGLQGISRDYY